MPKFFTESICGDIAEITGGDAAHITKVLRMAKGDRLTVSDTHGTDYFCLIESAVPELVRLSIQESRPSETEPSVKVTLFQGIPKSGKMDTIIQKCVELGIHSIYPVETARSVSRPDAKALKAKVERWNKIALEAAKQCGRGIIPTVGGALSFTQAVEMLIETDSPHILYEKAGNQNKFEICRGIRTAGIFIGPEGGFEEAEIDIAVKSGAKITGLGPRILRTETAPLCALTVIMFATGNL